MKSVLISIQPKWVEKIASGKKTIEVRKSKPKLETPFKCYIYCTNGTQLVDVRKEKIYLYLDVNKPFLLTNGKSNKVTCSTPPQVNRKVIGEFVCDKIEEVYQCNSGWVKENACISKDEFFDYLGIPRNTHFGYDKKAYAWHISDLKIYDKPKELSEFKVECPTKNKINGDCQLCKYANFSHYGNRPKCNAYLKRPPQSWCKVESLGE